MRLRAMAPAHQGRTQTRDHRLSSRPRTGEAVIAFRGCQRPQRRRGAQGHRTVCRSRRAARAGEDEFYHADLIGLEARDSEGRVLGKVTAMHNFGASDVIELTRARWRQRALGLHASETVPVIDIAAGCIVVAVPEDDEGTIMSNDHCSSSGHSDSVVAWRELMRLASNVLTLFPEMFPGPLGVSLLGKALDEKSLVAGGARHPRSWSGQASHAWTTRPPAAAPAW